MGLELPPHVLSTADHGSSFAGILGVDGRLGGVANPDLILVYSAVNADVWGANKIRSGLQSYNPPLPTQLPSFVVHGRNK